jgi:uncharacterized Zn finger protein
MVDEDKPKSHDQAFWQYSRTRKVEGGIKSQQRRGQKSPQAWWAQRWISVLESFDIGARLERGRSYARRGQVLSIDINKGEVNAAVQGSRREPYKVSIKIQMLSMDNWKLLAKEFASSAIYAAKLLARQMPQQIEDAFAAVGLSLFPSKHNDLQTKCSCPDWSNPCKHIAAVYYLLGEEFDRDPFVIFRLRGLDEDELMGLLDEQFGNGRDKKHVTQASEDRAFTVFDKPLSAEHDSFWRVGELPFNLSGHLEVPTSHAVLPRSLGSFPFWRGEQNLWQTLEQIYRDAAVSTRRTYTDLIAENTKNG